MAQAKKANRNEKGVAFEKRAKMDKAQQEIMLIAALASAVVGFTLVGSIFLIRTIIYNSKLISANEVIIDAYKDIQTNLTSIETQIGDLSTNESLESVARSRDSNRCSKYAVRSDLHAISEEEIELFKTCSSLRVISDAMPSNLNTEATLSSLNQLMNWSNEGTGVGFEGLSAMDGSVMSSLGFQMVTGTTAEGTQGSSNIHIINSSLKLNDSATRVKDALALIEHSIRNFDIVQAQLSFSGGDTLELSSTFSSYYSDPASLAELKYVVCADNDSEKCKSAGGDTAEKSKKGSSAASSEEETE